MIDMKQIVLLSILMLPLLATAQVQVNEKQQDLLGKGNMGVGISVGQGYRGNYPTTNSITPSVHYFLANGWSIALEGRYLKANSVYDFTYLGAGLSTRYYFLRGNRFALFAKLGVVYGQSNYHKWDPTDVEASLKDIPNANWQTNAGLGVLYRLGKRWSIEAVAERSWLPSSYLTPDYNRWQASIGINYRLR
jgi:outer membrane protein assembly factor BamA